jgi:uncharacterized membrane protein
MDITRNVSAGQRELVTAGNQPPVGKLWKAIAAVMFGLLLSIPGLAQAQYSYTTIDVPGSLGTSLNGNSTHEIVGDFTDENGVMHGFVRSQKGDFTTIDFPPAPPGEPRVTGTSLNGINASGRIMGTYFVDSETSPNHAFVLEKGHFTTLYPPFATRSQGGFINAQGQAVGAYRDGNANGKRRGFIWRKGVFTSFNHPLDGPDPSGTVPFGINDIGEVVGTYVGVNDTGMQGMHGFVRSPKGVFTSIDVPEASFTVAEGINNAGTIVGVYGDDKGLHGFVRSPKGVFTTIDLGAKEDTEINSINAKGEIVGFYIGDDGKQHGFVGTPDR